MDSSARKGWRLRRGRQPPCHQEPVIWPTIGVVSHVSWRAYAVAVLIDINTASCGMSAVIVCATELDVSLEKP